MTSTTLPQSDIGGLSVIDTGAGPTVLLLHGVGLRAQVWAPQIAALAPTHRVVAPDMPGHGYSPCPDKPMQVGGYASALRRVLDALDAPTLLVGHSMGAMIALQLAVDAADQVCGVVALNGIFARSPAAAKAVQARAAALDGAQVPDPTPTLTRWFGDQLSPARTQCETWLRATDPKGYQLAYRAFAYSDGPTPDALRKLHCPALFITGAEEPNSTPQMSQAMAALAPKGRALIIDGAAHMMPLTHATAVNTALRAFAQDVQP